METEAESVTPPLPPQAQVVNATTSNMFQLEMIRVIQDLQREMKELKKAGGQGSSNYKKKHSGNGERKPWVCKNTNKYYWSHRACAHKSVECS